MINVCNRNIEDFMNDVVKKIDSTFDDETIKRI